MNRFCAHAVMVAAALVGGGSLLLFGAFLVVGPIDVIRFTSADFPALVSDAAISAVFFLQHSGMIRGWFRRRLAARIPLPYHAAVYAIASGVALTAVVVAWQTLPTVVWRLHGPLRLLPRAGSLLAIAGFIWAIRSLRVFDPFGRRSICAGLNGRTNSSPALTLRGPYRWVRHPLYALTLVLIWSTPDMSLDRLFFAVLWTAWIVAGARLEERDLVAEFGDGYRRFQETVPMLVPWRGPAEARPPGRLNDRA